MLLAGRAEEFGFELNVTGRRNKFIFYEQVDVSARGTSLIRIDQTAPKGLGTFFYRGKPGSSQIEVALAMAIDTTRYRTAISN
jgi:hypothetical protein